MAPRAVLVALVLAIAPGHSPAQPVKTDPDWPCAQLYNPDLALAHVWSGPDPATVGGHWAADPGIAPLVPRLASAAVPLETSLRELDAFLATVPQAERSRRLPLLVAGLHEALVAERTKMIAGLSKLGRNQRELARAIRERNDQLAALRARRDRTEEAAALAETLNWELKIFEDRRATVSVACAQPDVIEKRLFALVKKIEAALPTGPGG